MAKITGIGGVFLKCKGDSAALAAWYQKHLGMQLEDFGGAILKWPDDTANDGGLTVWHVAAPDTRACECRESAGAKRSCHRAAGDMCRTACRCGFARAHALESEPLGSAIFRRPLLCQDRGRRGGGGDG